VTRNERLEGALGHRFVRPELLRQALTHRSFGSPHNERLEFLGDSVLNCVMATLLFERFPESREGELSRQRANLVRQDTLAEIARDAALGDQLLLGEGELKSGGFRRPSILADALEAVIGAIYLDAGLPAARQVIEALFRGWLDGVGANVSAKDAKTELQELLQGRKLPLPRYALVATRGEAHAQEFEVECTVPGLPVRTLGTGSSRRSAEQSAARRAVAEVRAA
jgi:ribonuclease-3